MSDNIDFIYNLVKEHGILALSDCEGCCPCGHFYCRGINIDFHCWRGGCDKCKYSGIHIKQHYDFNYSKEDLNKLSQLCLEQIKEVWGTTTEFDLIIEENLDKQL